MNMDAKPERINPTREDFDNMQREARSVSGGDTVHNINGIIGALDLIMGLATDQGWTDELRNMWNEKAQEIRTKTNKAKLERNFALAKEKGLL